MSAALSDHDLARAVEDHLAAGIAARPLPDNLREAIRYVLLAGGKRVRPLLLLRACEACGGTLEQALPAACAVELVHDFSLVHDDLPALDDDDLRRGRPTLHRHTSEAMAILAGDAMLALAFELLAVPGGPPQLPGALCAELARATNDMIAGQVYDSLPDFPAELDRRARLLLIHENKTRALIRCACRLGGLCAAASAEQLAALTRYGESIGLMFQVVDDLLDQTQSTEHLGKTARKDEVQGKLTYPAVLGLEESRREVERLRSAALEAIAPLGPRARALVELCDRLATRTR